jgi:hypothetical protein
MRFALFVVLLSGLAVMSALGDPACDPEGLTAWFHSIGGARSVASPYENPHRVLGVEPSSLGGLGVISIPNSTVPTKSVILSMPDATVFTKYSVTRGSRPYGPLLAASSQLPQEALIGLAVMFEMALGLGSPFAPWVQCLPPPKDLPMISMWQAKGSMCATPATTAAGEKRCRASAISEGATVEDTYILRSLVGPDPKHTVSPFKELKEVERELRKTTVSERKTYNSAGHPQAARVRVPNSRLTSCLASGATSRVSPIQVSDSGSTPLLEALQLCASALGSRGGGEASYFTADSYAYVQALLGSRAWYLSGDLVFVPFADMFNYAPVPPRGSPKEGIFQRPYNVVTDKPSFNFRTTDFIDHHSRITVAANAPALVAQLDGIYHPRPSLRAYSFGGIKRGDEPVHEFWEVTSDRPLSPGGQELLEYYGDSPNAIYFTYHGFTPGDIFHDPTPLLALTPQQNPHETVGVPVSLASGRAVAKLLPRKPVGVGVVEAVLNSLRIAELRFGEPSRLYPLHAASVIRYDSDGPCIDPVLWVWSLGPALAVMPPTINELMDTPGNNLDKSFSSRIQTCLTDLGKTLPPALQSHKAFVDLLRKSRKDCLNQLGPSAEAKLWRAKFREMRLRSIKVLLKQTYAGLFGSKLQMTTDRETNTSSFPDEVNDADLISSLAREQGHNAVNVLRFRIMKKRIVVEHFLLAEGQLRKLRPIISRLKVEISQKKANDEL